ncbi:Transcriptional regulator, TetR family OS=Tsukamurella paurometabola (strain ATCC 8368 / DSM/ CCUG 35730 / CIP 100753 / JCM 10117 / KCTC 9821 / NBRC 16120/ NCIMB 702349 / NCTC 13040) OX=521096 GN=Tpau_4179 PE=4 SV=1 [Tsukamurella paurometabola]|uniref:Transcriptional regulator, TetR family n=1 Tax=Tsukamurella paurometabola (strain ATCC 8368 / DSM 20162 / CCUG 35730 / CIP 100753 / JCM 10117 / KCTC 9821 / NBRC 16120 / NCIMB 702349 / NCTC 13040) TaxID=521096 RepID=D5UP39_TSUPD|nr:TetR/AcrR family transcriptional regulator [Tsukamurella paurometabola]ADG80748.1 transcriptional regulator, TetR family [Tsukamurella paurometabola DSM 20162]SUP40815.1 Fatty acid metabolism regulator protein [Tsukamurella paurometabola]
MTQARRKRPKDRREQIARVAAEDFSRRGYHGVGIEQIAASLDISGPAVYRHFPNKYALLEHAITSASDALSAAVAQAAQETEGQDAEARIDAIEDAALRVAFERRNTGGLFRWEQRLLERQDRNRIRDQLTQMIGTFADAAEPALPGVGRAERELRCVGVISVTGSVTAHRTVLAQRRAEAVLRTAGRRLLALPAPPTEYVLAPPPSSVAGTDAGRQEQVLDEAVELIFSHGFHNVSMGQIGQAAGIVPSGMYRYFPNKAGILVRALERSGAAMVDAIAAVVEANPEPRARLAALAQAYVQLSFGQSKLMTVYFREIGNVPDSDRSRLASVQRANIAAFADAVMAVRPDLGAAEATFLVHAAFAVVFDVGRTRRFDADPHFQAEVFAMVCAVLFDS